MDDTQTRLIQCFAAIFPELSADEIVKAKSTSIQGWDSVAGVTLLAVIEEEFDISIEVDDLVRFNSFDGLLSYLRETSTADLASRNASAQ